MRKNNGITLVSLVVTIIVILILAGITLNLISGSSGIINRTVAARKTNQIARYCEAQDLANAAVLTDMYSTGSSYLGLYQYIKNMCEENDDKMLETEDGIYWKDDDGILHFTDTKTKDDGNLIPDAGGNLMVKEVILAEGDVEDMTTKEMLKKEIEKAVGDIKKDYENSKNKGEFTGNLEEYIHQKLNEAGGSIKDSDTGGTIKTNGDGSYTYEDLTNPSNTAKFTIDENGNVTILDANINKPTVDAGKTEKDLQEELEKAMQEQKDKKNEEGDTGSLKDYIDRKISESGDGKLSTPITGGKISQKVDPNYQYEDAESPANTVDFTIDAEDNIEITKTEINNLGGNNPPPTVNLTKGNVEFEYSQTDWTNNPVTVKAVPQLDTTGYTIQTSKNGVVWNKTDTQTFMKNGAIYVRLFNGVKYGVAATANIRNIDTVQPVLTSVTATTSKIDITATDDASGIIKYAVTDTPEIPTSFETCENTKTFSKTIEGAQGETYYIWVKDEAGNINQNEGNKNAVTLGSVTALKPGDLSFERSTKEWTNQPVTITVTPNIDIGDFSLYLSTDKENWVKGPSIELTQNGTVYAILKDEAGQPGKSTASVIVDNIDTTKPEVTEVVATTNSFVFKAKDEDSGIAGYAVTPTNTQPTDFTPVENGPKEWQKLMESMKNNTPYYVWVKDVAGNVSEIGTKVDLKAVDNANSTNLSVESTTWNGTEATVTFSTTTDYQIQWCTTQSTNDSDWTTGAVAKVQSGTTIYVRLWDGTNSGTSFLAHTPILTYKIRYNANGGSGTMADSTHEYGKEKALTANAFTRTSYKFVGWATSASGAKTYDNSQSVTNLSSTNGDIVNLWAVWQLDTANYKVVHQQMDTNGTTYTTVDTENSSGKVGENVTPTVRTYEGFTSPSAQTVAIAADGNTTITYKYTRNKYTITYNSNGGTSCSATTAYYGAAITMPTPTKDKSTFAGWSTKYTTMPLNGATVTASWTGISGIGTSVIKGEYYGDKVNYSANGVTDWKVFLNKDGYVYIITSNYVPVGKLPTTTVSFYEPYGVYIPSNTTTSASYLKNYLDNNANWANFNSTYADNAKGAPTLEQFLESYQGKGYTYRSNGSMPTYILDDGHDDTLYFLPSVENGTRPCTSYWLNSYYNYSTLGSTCLHNVEGYMTPNANTYQGEGSFSGDRVRNSCISSFEIYCKNDLEWQCLEFKFIRQVEIM